MTRTIFACLLRFALPIAVGLTVLAMGCATGPRPPQISAPSVIHMNDTVTVTFSDGSTGEDSRVKEDGTITLHFNQTFVAAGKTPLELRRDIYDRYAPKSTSPPHLTVSVRTDDLYYTITGELPEPVRVQWLGPVTVFQALHDAGLLDEHLKQRVILIRSNGRRLVVNFVKAIEDQRLDPHVLPGDTIHLPRRGL